MTKQHIENNRLTDRVANLEMLLRSPSIQSKVSVAVSAQQWHLINSITDTNHPSHTHKAKQTQYTLLHTAQLEIDGTEMAVYIDESSQIWVRPMSEFQEKFTENPVVFVPLPEFFDDEDDAWA
nr:MAG TPA: Protein of unknown function (DUF1653) [Caudoviricetes sp.]